jgi:hypothetical protein
MILLRAFVTAATCDLGGISFDANAIRPEGALAGPTNPAPNAAMPPKTLRLPIEKLVDRSLETLTCDSLSRSLTVPSTSFDLADHQLNGRCDRTNAFIVPQRFPKDRPIGEILYSPTAAGTIKVSA